MRYALNIVRTKNILATVLTVFATAVGVPEISASQCVAGTLHERSAAGSISPRPVRESPSPAEAAAFRHGARMCVVAAARSNPLQRGIAAARVVTPAPTLSGIVVRASRALTPSTPFSSPLVRGPPLAV